MFYYSTFHQIFKFFPDIVFDKAEILRMVSVELGAQDEGMKTARIARSKQKLDILSSRFFIIF